MANRLALTLRAVRKSPLSVASPLSQKDCLDELRRVVRSTPEIPVRQGQMVGWIQGDRVHLWPGRVGRFAGVDVVLRFDGTVYSNTAGTAIEGRVGFHPLSRLLVGATALVIVIAILMAGFVAMSIIFDGSPPSWATGTLLVFAAGALVCGAFVATRSAKATEDKELITRFLERHLHAVPQP